MIRTVCISLVLCCTVSLWAAEPESKEGARVSGEVHVGLSTEIQPDCDKMDLTYMLTGSDDPRLGGKSGNRYLSELDEQNNNLQAEYGADLNIKFNPQHSLNISFDGEHDYERAFGTRLEKVTAPDGSIISLIKGTYDRPRELKNELKAGLDYTYHLRRPGELFTVGYRYRWENESAGVEQEIEETEGLKRYSNYMLEQKFNNHHHNLHAGYTLPVAKGHLLDFGVCYDRRELSVKTEQEWDEVRTLDTEYRHLTQYGGVHARYRLRLGPVEAMAKLEYRATKMQQRWLHDVLPTAAVTYHIDTVHSLTAFYTMALVRPELKHLDTTKIADAYTLRFGNNNITGIHIHNVALTYRMKHRLANWSTEVRYLTTNDGFNAIWMVNPDNMTRTYTWGNEGQRHAVSIKPSVEAHLCPLTDLDASVTVLWDKRIAESINMQNANWGVRTHLRITQGMLPTSYSGPLGLHLVLRGDYSYHNTLDVYSYEDHGGNAEANIRLRVATGRSEKTKHHAILASLGYNCHFRPDVCITQGGFTGRYIYSPGASHTIAMRLAYHF